MNPILRWAGGKRHLVHRLAKLAPSGWNRYVEPMAGAASMFFHLEPTSAVLADVNKELINFYRVLRDDTDSLVESLRSLPASRGRYYAMRKDLPRTPLKRAVRFAYLNRLCWNGLYRVNREGEFNVPIGDRIPKVLWDYDELRKAALLLKRTVLHARDFQSTATSLRKGDFVFFDPPYPKGAREGMGFNRFHSKVFTEEDHMRMAETLNELDRRSVMFMIIVSASSRVAKHYPTYLSRRYLNGKSLISADEESRRGIRELVLVNYEADWI